MLEHFGPIRKPRVYLSETFNSRVFLKRFREKKERGKKNIAPGANVFGGWRRGRLRRITSFQPSRWLFSAVRLVIKRANVTYGFCISFARRFKYNCWNLKELENWLIERLD